MARHTNHTPGRAEPVLAALAAVGDTPTARVGLVAIITAVITLLLVVAL